MFSYIHRLFVPHESNNHRAQLLHHKNLFALVLLLVITSALLLSVRKAAPSVLGVATNISTDALLTITNQKRQAEGLVALRINPELSAAASAKAADMFSKNYWAHNAPDGTTPWVFFQHAGYNYVYAGENLAKDFDNSEGVINGWMGSPSHRENMLNAKYEEVGFAVVNGTLNGQETTLVVEELGKRQGVSVAAVPVSHVRPTAQVTPKALLSPTAPVREPLVTAQNRSIRVTPGITSQRLVAGITNNPIIDSAGLTKRISLAVLAVVVLAFVLDMFYIERKKLVRLVGHNSDHILFLLGVILLILLFGKGVTL